MLLLKLQSLLLQELYEVEEEEVHQPLQLVLKAQLEHVL